MQAAYPIHPEIFDRLYGDWSTLVKFQRTRGVLRLMAAVINSLWEKGDRNPLIMPGNIPIDDPRVQNELTRYLSDNWVPVLEKDVDGPGSLPQRIDGEVSNLGKYAACRRVARTIYLGSAPTATAAHKGIEDRSVKLGCVMPGESSAIFGDALRRLAGAATYLYQDGTRYWYSTQPTVTKIAEDRAEQFLRNPDRVVQELDRRIRENLHENGDFSRIHSLPQGGQDVPDDLDARLVVLGIDHPFTKELGCQAEIAAKEILESRGNTPRLYRNTLVFLAADRIRLQDLEEAVARYLAWDSILAEKDTQNLSTHQVRQAETQKTAAGSVVAARIPETYQWLLVPGQATPQTPIEWQAIRLTGSEPLAVRASKKLKSGELLIRTFAATRLRMELDKIPLWRGNHVEIKQLTEDFARYLYLPRLRDPLVLLSAVTSGVDMLTWELEGFAIADSFDEIAVRYRGLRAGAHPGMIESESSAMLVKSAVAKSQRDTEAAATSTPADSGGGAKGPESPGGVLKPPIVTTAPVPQALSRRFYGTVELDPTRMGRDAGRIADEVVSHLNGLVGSNVRITLDIHADAPSGISDNTKRTISENCRTLKFKSSGFEKE